MLKAGLCGMRKLRAGGRSGGRGAPDGLEEGPLSLDHLKTRGGSAVLSPSGVCVEGKKEISPGLCLGPAVSGQMRVRPGKAIKDLRTPRTTASSPGSERTPAL